MAIYPETAVHPRDKLALQASPEELEDLDVAERDYLALLATSWAQNIVFEPKPDRYNLTLPEGARLLRLLPDRGEAFVVFGLDQELQVWRGVDWLEKIRGAAAATEELREAFRGL